jgi:catechol 2,3-dioxygenase-like lactoylglutathione lyase family enzyme
MQGTQLRYVIKFVADMDKGVKFYRDVLGLKLKFESPGWSEFVTGDSTLAAPGFRQKPSGKGRIGLHRSRLRGLLAGDEREGRAVQHAGVLAQFVDSEGAHCSVGAEAA